MEVVKTRQEAVAGGAGAAPAAAPAGDDDDGVHHGRRGRGERTNVHVQVRCWAGLLGRVYWCGMGWELQAQRVACSLPCGSGSPSAPHPPPFSFLASPVGPCR